MPYAPPSSYAVGAPMPTAAYSQNIFYLAVSAMLSLVLTMRQLFLAVLTKAVVVKELRLKQTMRIMGLCDGVHFVVVLTAVLQFALIAALCTAVIKMFVVQTSTIVLLYVSLFCLGAISFVFLSVFFSTAVLSAVVGLIAFFGALLPRYLFGSNRYERVEQKFYASLLPLTAFAFGADILADYELSEVGISTDNWAQDDYLDVAHDMALDTLLYALLGLYPSACCRPSMARRARPLPHASGGGCAAAAAAAVTTRRKRQRRRRRRRALRSPSMEAPTSEPLR